MGTCKRHFLFLVDSILSIATMVRLPSAAMDNIAIIPKAQNPPQMPINTPYSCLHHTWKMAIGTSLLF